MQELMKGRWQWRLLSHRSNEQIRTKSIKITITIDVAEPEMTDYRLTGTSHQPWLNPQNPVAQSNSMVDRNHQIWLSAWLRPRVWFVASTANDASRTAPIYLHPNQQRLAAEYYRPNHTNRPINHLVRPVTDEKDAFQIESHWFHKPIDNLLLITSHTADYRLVFFSLKCLLFL